MTIQIPELDFGTVGLLFPAISLLMLAYTNRFLGLASVARHLVALHREHPHPRLKFQVENLQKRIALIRHTQAAGVLSLLGCTVSLFSLFMGSQAIAQISFGISLFLMLTSLVISSREIFLSGRAINAELNSLIEDSGH